MPKSWNSAPAPCARFASCWTRWTSPRGYTPIDISGAYLRDLVRPLAEDYPALAMIPLVADFTLPLMLPPSHGARRAGFFPGGTIGNFRPDAAQAMLRRMREQLDGGGLLIGVDLVKDPATLHAAYNDAAGVTAAFNKNLLARANRELDAGFDLDAFAHYAPYNVASHRVEMYLVSLKRQSVQLADETSISRRAKPFIPKTATNTRSKASARWRRAPGSARARYGPTKTVCSRSTGLRTVKTQQKAQAPETSAKSPGRCCPGTGLRPAAH